MLARFERLHLPERRQVTQIAGMSTLAKNRKPVAKKSARKSVAKKPATRKAAGPNEPKTFGEWAKRVAGMVKDAPSDLSTREGFGH